MIENVVRVTGNQDLGISVIVLTELLHGVGRATNQVVRLRREDFLKQLTEDLLVYDYTVEIGRLAGRIGGEQAAKGETIPFVDLMIGVTALSMGFSILTANERHFRMIPGLDVIAF